MTDDPKLTDFLTTNTESRPWTADEWCAAIERFKRHPGYQPPPYVVVSPAEFYRRLAAGEIDENGHLLHQSSGGTTCE